MCAPGDNLISALARATGDAGPLSAYRLAFAALILHRLRPRRPLGRRRVSLAGIAVFTAASAACALAPDITVLIAVLIAARAVQGAGPGRPSR